MTNESAGNKFRCLIRCESCLIAPDTRMSPRYQSGHPSQLQPLLSWPRQLQLSWPISENYGEIDKIVDVFPSVPLYIFHLWFQIEFQFTEAIRGQFIPALVPCQQRPDPWGSTNLLPSRLRLIQDPTVSYKYKWNDFYDWTLVIGKPNGEIIITGKWEWSEKMINIPFLTFTTLLISDTWWLCYAGGGAGSSIIIVMRGRLCNTLQSSTRQFIG